MQWIEQNIDAYRIVGEIITSLRTSLRKQLEEVHGREWHKIGVPAPLIDRLIERKEREKSIDWYETEYQELIDFASFSDLLEILEHNPEILPQVSKLAPSSALLHARLLELEVMRLKLGMARPISETELSFLGTFHLRFRQAMTDEDGPRRYPERTPEPANESAEPAPASDSDEEQKAEVDDQAASDDDPTPEAEPEPKDIGTRPIKVVKDQPPRRPTIGPSAPQPEEPPAEDSTAPAQEAAPEPAAQVHQGPISLEQALDRGDHRAILRELYREVMTIAEGMWTNEAPPLPVVWEKVRVSNWYEVSFSKRGLKPLADFYYVIDQVQKRSRDGLTRDGLQRFLKEANFAQLLLSLRDMFQKNQI